MSLLFHYTNRRGAQEIAISGEVRPGATGVLYVTPDLYDSGAAAADKLGITGKAVEVVLGSASWDAARDVRIRVAMPVRDGGRVVRSGGGGEVLVRESLPRDPGSLVFELRAP